MHLPFSSGSILSSVDIQGPDLRAITDQMEERGKNAINSTTVPYDKSNALYLSEEEITNKKKFIFN